MPNKPKCTQFKHLKGVSYQIKEMISEKILISGKSMPMKTPKYFYCGIIINLPTKLTAFDRNLNPSIKNEEDLDSKEIIDKKMPY
ncbi:hypothetical protein AYI68_g4911 [Smittium mucronatum]|uniref:Uncharacterized protein n=1 Tax=Smittium mucronatum TaxID=133383 RepID=A0A1R0GVU1_9FUNG|nr:hypothetical protein AYI68_g4911 [Smittium mucronatum]